MKKRKIFFRADANANIGYGHYIRSLALAEMLRNDYECCFFTASPTLYQIGEAEKVCKCIALKEDNKLETFLEYLSGDEIVVLDNYFYASEYQYKIKAIGCKLVCIDDMHDKHYFADLVINHAVTDRSLFDIEPYTKLCLGLEYALLRPPFLKVLNVERTKDTWLIAFGGTDVDNLTEKFIQILNSDVAPTKISVIVGDAYQYIENLRKYKNISIYKNLSADQMRRLMCSTEYAILPSSTICIEALFSDCKIASGFDVDNQTEFYSILKEKRLVYPLGNLLEFSEANLVNNIRSFSFNKSINIDNVQNRILEAFNGI